MEALRKRGRILGGGRSFKERELKLYLNHDMRSVRNAKRISDEIGTRFYDYDDYGSRESMAHAKTDTEIELKIMPQYEDNHDRYIKVVRQIAFQEKPVSRHVRMTKLKDKLLDPVTAERAAIELEAIGLEAIPTLESGLKSEWLEVRFHSAMALAYIGQPTGLDVLAEAAEKEHAFRIYALAAMTAVDDIEAHLKLRELINKVDIVSAETRYGAFRALSTLDKNDPYIRGENMNDQFMLHEVKSEAAPMIHLTTRKQAEVVLFGIGQRFKTPVVLRAGKEVLIKGDAGNDTLTVCNFHLPDQEQQRTVSTKISDVIKAAVEMGASYPDIAEMLTQAEQQHNLPGRLAINALPKSGQYYIRPEVASGTTDKKGKKVRVGNSNDIPNIFSEQRNHDARLIRSDDKAGLEEVVNDGGIQPATYEEEIKEEDESPTDDSLKKSKYVERRTKFYDFKIPKLFRKEE
ncbi:MAG: HEAT repeat domain-containing protein [Planctomycetaceae bacterium]